MAVLTYIVNLIQSTLISVADYLSFHVLLCLIPAFFIAGAMGTFIPTDSIIKYLGVKAPKIISYPAAVIAGLLLAVCSCTVIPLFVGIYKKGAGLGPAMTFFFVAPAINILALMYTGTLIGMDIAIARGLLAIIFSVVIGFIMDRFFTKTSNEEIHSLNEYEIFKLNSISVRSIVITLLILISLLSGVLLVLIQNQQILFALFFVGTLSLIFLSLMAENKKLILFLWLVFELFVGTSQIKLFTENLIIADLVIVPELSNMLLKASLVLIHVIIITAFVIRFIEKDDYNEWMTETWEFIKSIFPLIILGVFIAGALKFIIPQQVIISLVGKNNVFANLLAVSFGVFMYFPTLMEVPIAKTFLSLGMAKGPLLAYLLADPELSIQSILVTRKYIGDKKNIVYVLLVTILTTIAGIIFGIFVGENFTF